jgi:hypothetical protein
LVHLSFGVQRGLRGREPGFQIEARRHAQHLELAVRDNGAGLDLKRLQELAQKMNFVPSEGRSIADVVFLDGTHMTHLNYLLPILATVIVALTPVAQAQGQLRIPQFDPESLKAIDTGSPFQSDSNFRHRSDRSYNNSRAQRSRNCQISPGWQTKSRRHTQRSSQGSHRSFGSGNCQAN